MQTTLLLNILFLGQIVKEPDAPVPPREAPLRMTVPPGFKVTLFAGEPDVKQPIAFTFDDRGRLWVVENYSYPKWHKDPKDGKDRVLIFEDTDGDGVFDKRTVFADNLSNLSGIEYGFGGIWLCSLPNLLYIPIKEGEDRPAGPPEIKLDGWSLQSSHNVFSNLKWGPDGWLYGCNGIIATSKVGAPGTADKERVPINCGVWRYHPTKKKFEAYAWGTTNPWGLDWDEHGEMFITNCVISHLWHVVPGAHFERMYGQDLNPHVYGLMKSCADHLHWAGGSWTTSRGGKGAHSDAGGGHAHVGCMIYLGDNWPDRYRNGVFMCNLHGSRINHDVLERNGSSYVARHGKDFLFANDPWFRGIAIDYGPDGGVFVTDWTDTGECHNYKTVDPTNGRIYKIMYEPDPKASGGRKPPSKLDLAKMSDEELVKLQLHRNEWFVRHARRILHERASAGKLAPKIASALKEILRNVDDESPAESPKRLRLLWALHAIGSIDEDVIKMCRFDPGENVRAWLIQLILQNPVPDKELYVRFHFASQDASPLVRLHLAGALQRMPFDKRFKIAFSLVHRFDESLDPYLPLMTWYGVESLVRGDLEDGLQLLSWSRTPQVRELLARRIASYDDKSFMLVLDMPKWKHAAEFHRDVLRGVQEALKDRRSVQIPKSWPEVFPILMESPLEEVRERALALAVQMGDERALTTSKQIALDDKSSPRIRNNALTTLLLRRPDDLAPLLQGLLKDATLRGASLKGLAAFNDPKTPELILDQYKTFTPEEKLDAVQTLSSRIPYALALLDAVEKKRVPAEDLSNFTVRQMQALNSKDVTDKFTKVWGSIRPAAADKVALMAKYKKTLTADYVKAANKSRGRALFAKSCAACHRLFDSGGAIGPDITGSQRHNLDYILENIVDPSAVVAKEYQVAVVITTGGRTVTGLIKQETDRAVSLQTQNELIVLPRNEIESLKRTTTSMMPDGLMDNLRLEEVRDLIGYLASPVQVPLPAN